MTIKSWVTPVVSLALSELQIEFGCEALPVSTTTTFPPESTTTTTTTSTSTTTTTTTLAPGIYNPILTISGFNPPLKSGTNTTRVISFFLKGSTYQFAISNGPPTAVFAFKLTLSNLTEVTINGILDLNGNWLSDPDSSATWSLGLATAEVVFTPLVGQTITFSNDRKLEITVSLATTSTTTVPTTTLTPVFAGLCRTLYNTNPNVQANGDYDPTWFETAPVIGRTIDLLDNPTSGVNFPPSVETYFSVEWLGYFIPSVSGNYTFYLDNIDDIAGLWVDHNSSTVAENNYTLSNIYIKKTIGADPTAGSTLTMTANRRYFIRLQYIQATGPKSLGLSWAGPGQSSPTRNFTGKIWHSTCLPINQTTSTTTTTLGPGSTSTTTTTTTTIALQTGTAFLTASNGTVATLYGSATLPISAVKLMFRLIGAGGSGGGADGGGGYGGDGAGGGVLLGSVILPATSDVKILKAGIGMPGTEASSSDNNPHSGGAGGKGYGLVSYTQTANGGNGALPGPYGRSGAGGAGGGATAIYVESNNIAFPIASAGGGGGGGGGSNYVAGLRGTVPSTSTVIDQSVTASLDGASAVRFNNDGGGGGGGGGNNGQAGVNGFDRSFSSGGGTSGQSAKNTSSYFTWEHYQYWSDTGSGAVDASISNNKGFFGIGGKGSSSTYSRSIPGTQGAVAVYWTTDINEIFDQTKISDFPPTSYVIATITLPDRVDTADNNAGFNFYADGRLATITTGFITPWSSITSSNLGNLYEMQISGSGTSSNLFTMVNITPNTWTSMHQTITFHVLYSTIEVTVQIRRKYDNFVLIQKNIILNSEQSPSVAG